MKSLLFLSFSLLLFLPTNPISGQEWHTDFDKAKTLAAQESKQILLVFQGSDWCAPCIKLEKKIWSSLDFKHYAKDHLILLQADFPRRKRNALSDSQAAHNAQLAEKYNAQGVFPLVVILDKSGNTIGETGYKKLNASEYISHLEALIKS